MIFIYSIYGRIRTFIWYGLFICTYRISYRILYHNILNRIRTVLLRADSWGTPWHTDNIEKREKRIYVSSSLYIRSRQWNRTNSGTTDVALLGWRLPRLRCSIKIVHIPQP